MRVRFVLSSMAMLWVLLTSPQARGGSFDFGPAASAGPAGTISAPDLMVRFAGDGLATVSQADFGFDGNKLQLTPTGVGGAMCEVVGGDRLRIIGPLRLTPLPSSPTAFCSVRVAIRVGVAPGSTALSPVPGSVLCVSSDGSEYACSASGAVVSIGAAMGSARIDYSPAPGATVVASSQRARIEAGFVPGSPGDSIVVSQCAMSGDNVFEQVTSAPSPLTFAGASPASGGIEVSCRTPSPAGSGQLSCAQSINGGPPTILSWTIQCPSSLVAPSVSYQPAAGSLVEVRSINVIGAVDSVSIGAIIARDGAGTGAEATTSISGCTATEGFDVMVVGGSISAEADAGASGEIIVSCLASMQSQVGVMSCAEDRGGSVAARQWELVCPAGRTDAVFVGEFE